MKRFFSFWIASIICINASAQTFKVTLQAPQYKKGIAFLALEYFIFLGLATYGLLNWKKQLNNG